MVERLPQIERSKAAFLGAIVACLFAYYYFFVRERRKLEGHASNIETTAEQQVVPEPGDSPSASKFSPSPAQPHSVPELPPDQSLPEPDATTAVEARKSDSVPLRLAPTAPPETDARTAEEIGPPKTGGPQEEMNEGETRIAVPVKKKKSKKKKKKKKGSKHSTGEHTPQVEHAETPADKQSPLVKPEESPINQAEKGIQSTATAIEGLPDDPAAPKAQPPPAEVAKANLVTATPAANEEMKAKQEEQGTGLKTAVLAVNVPPGGDEAKEKKKSKKKKKGSKKNKKGKKPKTPKEEK